MTGDTTKLRPESPLNQKEMTEEEALKVIAYHQAWRKGGDSPQTDPTKLTKALYLIPKIIESKEREIAELKAEREKLAERITELLNESIDSGMQIRSLKAEIERLTKETQFAFEAGRNSINPNL